MRFYIMTMGLSVFTVLSSCGSDSANQNFDGSSSIIDGSSTCTCRIVKYNNDKTISCGQEACLAGKLFKCKSEASPDSSTGGIEEGGTCEETNPTESACSSIMVKNQPSYKCKQATEYCILSVINAEVQDYLCAPRPSGCTSCDCAESNAEFAWNKVKTGWNCDSDLPPSCESYNGAITITCAKTVLH